MENNRNVEGGARNHGQGAAAAANEPPPPAGGIPWNCFHCGAQFDSDDAILEHWREENIEEDMRVLVDFAYGDVNVIGGTNRQGSGSSRQPPLVSYSQASSSSSMSLPHPGYQAYDYGVGSSTLPSHQPPFVSYSQASSSSSSMSLPHPGSQAYRYGVGLSILPSRQPSWVSYSQASSYSSMSLPHPGNLAYDYGVGLSTVPSHQPPFLFYSQASSSSSMSLPHPGNQAYRYGVGLSTLPSHPPPFLSYSQASSSSSMSLPHPGNQAYHYGVGLSTLPSHQPPFLSHSVWNIGQEIIDSYEALYVIIQQFLSLLDRPATVQEGLPSLRLPNWNFGQESSSSRTPQNESTEWPLFNVNERQIVQETSNSSILHQTQSIEIHRQRQLLMAQGSTTGSSHQRWPSYSSQNFGQEISNSSRRPQTQNIDIRHELQHPMNFGQESSSNSRGPQNENIQRQFGQESSKNASTFPQAQRVSRREFESLMDQEISRSSRQPWLSNSAVPVGEQGLPSSRSHPQTQRVSRREFESLMDQEISRSSHQSRLSNAAVPVGEQGLPSSRSHPQTRRISQRQFKSLMAQEISGSSHYEGSSDQESNSSAIRPQNASKKRCDKSSGQKRSPAKSNVNKRLEPSRGKRKLDQASSSSVTVPQNSITEGERPDSDLNVKPTCDDENSGQQFSSSSTPGNGAQE